MGGAQKRERSDGAGGDSEAAGLREGGGAPPGGGLSELGRRQQDGAPWRAHLDGDGGQVAIVVAQLGVFVRQHLFLGREVVDGDRDGNIALASVSLQHHRLLALQTQDVGGDHGKPAGGANRAWGCHPRKPEPRALPQGERPAPVPGLTGDPVTQQTAGRCFTSHQLLNIKVRGANSSKTLDFQTHY